MISVEYSGVDYSFAECHGFLRSEVLLLFVVRRSMYVPFRRTFQVDLSSCSYHRARRPFVFRVPLGVLFVAQLCGIFDTR